MPAKMSGCHGVEKWTAIHQSGATIMGGCTNICAEGKFSLLANLQEQISNGHIKKYILFVKELPFLIIFKCMMGRV